MRVGIKTPPRLKPSLSRQRREIVEDLRYTAKYITREGSKIALEKSQAAIKAAGLGNLGRALGATSSSKGGNAKVDENTEWGVVYIRPGPESRAAGALGAYTKGAMIRAVQHEWLAFPTRNIPQRINRYKTTPARYIRSGLVQSIGPLRFIRKSATRAVLVVDDVEVSRRTGRARAKGKRKSKAFDQQKELVAFVLIRQTYRAKRHSQKAVMQDVVRNDVPRLVEESRNRQR